jgi:hypothetical protein
VSGEDWNFAIAMAFIFVETICFCSMAYRDGIREGRRQCGVTDPPKATAQRRRSP